MATGLPSPPASAASPASIADLTQISSRLPSTRQHPLKPGSKKEISLIGYMDRQIIQIQRRYGLKATDASAGDGDAPGYTSFDQVIDDVDPLIDLAWVSGTPALQIAYLLTLAGTIASYMPAFPFSARAFRPLKKLDDAFLAMIRAASTPSPNGSPLISKTDKVRIKSLAETTRVTIVNLASQTDGATTADISEVDSGDEDEESADEVEDDQEPTAIGMGLGRVYRKTLEALGDELI